MRFKVQWIEIRRSKTLWSYVKIMVSKLTRLLEKRLAKLRVSQY